MSRNTLAAVVVLALLATSVLSAGDVYTGPIPLTKTSALDKRTDFEKLQGQVDEMSFFLDEALAVIDQHEQRIDDLEDALADNQAFIDDLKDHISVGSDSVTVSASTISLDAGIVKLEAPMVRADGIVRSDSVVTDHVSSKSYTPGAGNVW